jgi:hypothetical protein
MAHDTNPSTPPLEYKVPRLLWENFEAVLLAQSRRYIGELARHLNVPEKELQRKVLPSSDSLKVMVMDTQADTFQCQAHIQQDNITSRCRKPVAYHSTFCASHRERRMTVFLEESTPRVEKVKPSPTRPPIWIRGSTLIQSKGEIVGKINKDRQTVKWFVLEE